MALSATMYQPAVAKVRTVPHNRIRPKYNPVMTAAEKAHADKVRASPCFGCGVQGVSAHHTLLKFPDKRWRRDHYWLLGVCDREHRLIHDYFGTEEAWLDSIGRTPEEAIEHMRGLHDG